MPSWANEYFIEFSDSDSGDGSSGSPWGRFAYGMSELRALGLANGDTKVWVKETASEDTSVNGLSDSDMPASTSAKRLWVEGFATTTGDGSIETAQVLTNTSSATLIDQSAGGDYQYWKFLEFKGAGGPYGVRTDRHTHFDSVVFSGTMTTACLLLDAASGARVDSSVFLNVKRAITSSGAALHVENCFIEIGSNGVSGAINISSGAIENCTVYVHGLGSTPIDVLDILDGAVVSHNTIFVNSDSTNVTAIPIDRSSTKCRGNYIEGAKVAIDMHSNLMNCVKHNRFFGNTTNISDGSSGQYESNDNTTLASTGLAKSGNPDRDGWMDYFEGSHSEYDPYGRHIGSLNKSRAGGSSGFPMSRIVN